MNSLRPYQEKLFLETRVALRKNRSVAVQLNTGGGKSHIFAAITSSAYEKKRRVWICVPKSELLWQASKHLFNRNIPHGIIKSTHKESNAYHVHVISMSTIKRRIKDNKIKNFPEILIFDENHIEILGQKYIVENSPETTKIIGFSATQERFDRNFLKHCKAIDFFNSTIWKEKPKYNGIYDVMVKGPPLNDLIEMEYLSPFRYYSPPIKGLEDLTRRGADYDEKELETFFKRNQVYGKAIKHYRELADGKTCLVYCRSVKAAEDTADQFNAAGYRFASIDGKMTDKQREQRINSLKDGTIQGLTSCEILAVGLDIPSVECVIMLRPTFSRPLFFQMIGRGIRVSPGKKECIILDHVGNCTIHLEFEAGKSLYEIMNVDWKFCGNEPKRGKKKGKNAIIMRFCEKCYQWFMGESCDCGHKKAPLASNIKEIDGRLIELKGPISLRERPPEERRQFEDMISAAKAAYMAGIGNAEIDYGPIKELCKIAEQLGYSIMWCYHKLNELEYAVNMPLLSSLQHVKKYKHGWAHFKRLELQKRNRQPETQEAPF